MTGATRRAGHANIAVAWLAAFALPVLESPTASDPVAPTRLVLLGLVVALGLLAVPTGELPRPVVWALLAALSVFALAALLSATPILSLLGRYPRYEGLPVVAGYAACVLIGARVFAQDASARLHLERALAASAGLSGAASLIQVVLLPGERVIGTLGNSSTLGIWGVLSACVLGWRLVEDRAWWLWAGAASGLLVVLLSASRAAQAALVVACALAVLLRLRAAPRPAWWQPLVPIVVLVLGVLAVPTARARIVGATPFSEATVTGRALLWKESLDLFLAHPIKGVGPSRFVDSIGPFHTPQWAATVGPYAPPDSPHNLVLQVASATGLMGLVVVALLAATWLMTLWRAGTLDAARGGAVLAVSGAAVAYLAGFTDLITTPMVCLLAGLAVGTGRDAPPRVVLPRLGAGIALVATVVLAGSVLVSEWTLGRALTAPTGQQELLRAAVAQRSWDPDLRRRATFVEARLVEAGAVDPTSALDGAAGLCESLPGSIECLHTWADLEDLAGRHADALGILDHALALDPTNVDTILKQGIAHAGARDWPAAEAAFQQASELRPTAPEPWDNLAHLHDLEGRTADAEAARARAEVLRGR